MKLSSSTSRKFIETYPGNGRKILTPDGYAEILYVHKTIPYMKVKLILSNNLELECASNHVIIDEFNNECYAINSLGINIKTVDGIAKVIEVLDLQVKEHMYDISIDSKDELYYSNGILSHNSGKSVTTAIYLVHLYSFGKDLNIGIVANKGPMAREFLANAKNMFIDLPVWMQQGTSVWNKGSIENESKMRILTDVPSSDSFRGFTISCLDGKSLVNVLDTHNNYKTISLEELYSTGNITSKLSINDKYLIETDNGYKAFSGIRKTTNTGIIITHSGGEIRCTKEHKILIADKFIEAQTLEVNQYINEYKISKISPDKEKVYYDPVEVQGDNTYISEGITHHNCLIVDETAFLKPTVWDEFSNSIFPSQSGLAWKKNIMLSTANGENFFSKMVKEARAGTNGMEIFEVDWYNVPRYKSDGSLLAPEEFQKNVIEKHGVIHFKSNYENSFLGSSYTLISSDKLALMQHSDIEEIRDAKLKIYHYPKKKHKYIMSIDAAKDGTDAFAVQIVDITDFRFIQVASAQLQIDYLLMPEFINEWCELYNNPYLIIENNEGAGQSIADQMYQTYDYENLHFDKDIGRNKRKKYPGFRTTTKTRKQMLQTMKLFIENNKLEINDKSTINEFFQFILLKNKFQADEGAHDDMIMSLALVFVPFCNAKNFNDMKALITNIYKSDTIADSEKVEFGDLLSVGSFDDGTDEEYLENKNSEYLSIEDAMDNMSGFY